jgi:hypothetical protein
MIHSLPIRRGKLGILLLNYKVPLLLNQSSNVRGKEASTISIVLL